MEWDTACPDWAARLMAGRSLVPDLPLFADEAARALRIFKRLRLPDVIGQPRMGEAGGEWFFRVVEALFGAYDPVQNARMVQEVFLLVPKKNAKSTGAAGVMVTAIIVNRRPEAEFVFIAPTIEVAGISFRQARGIIRADPELTKLFHVQDNIRRITHRRTGALLQIKAADTDVVTGGKQVGTLIDETHVFAGNSRAADIFTEIRGALAARPDGFLIQITTQSKSPPSGVFKAELEWARDVRDGKLRFPKPRLPVLYELPAVLGPDAWKDEKNWALVNPNLGRSVDIDYLRSGLVDAERQGPAQLALFASQHFNVEIGISLRSSRWAGAEYWRACGPKNGDNPVTFDDLLEQCDLVVPGIDGGGLDDLLGLAMIGRHKQSRKWLVWTHAWAHQSVLDRRKDIAAALSDFEADGDLTVVQTLGEDTEAVADYIEQIEQAGLLADKTAIGVDQMGIGEIPDALAVRGIDPARIGGVPQGWKLMNAIKTVERKLAAGQILHSGSRLMAWCVGNAKVEPRGNAIMITKQTAGSAKIDPLMALFDAAAVMLLNPEGAPARPEIHVY